MKINLHKTVKLKQIFRKVGWQE